MPHTSSYDAQGNARCGYVGRFAPSPSGPLHRGSLVAALASLLDARAHGGLWRLRIEDTDTPRMMPGGATRILRTLERFGFQWDGEVVLQSRRGAAYEHAWAQLAAQGRVYRCTCTRREIADSGAPGVDGAPVYPGTCRTHPPDGQRPAAWRLRVDDGVIEFDDRQAGRQVQALAGEVGDFIVKRADGIWAYQLAAVVDDAEAGITDVVRGADLLASTARQIFLQTLLDLPTPRYLHVPLVTLASGEKLSKQTGAAALDDEDVLESLEAAAAHLGLSIEPVDAIEEFWAKALPAWRSRYMNERENPSVSELERR